MYPSCTIKPNCNRGKYCSVDFKNNNIYYEFLNYKSKTIENHKIDEQTKMIKPIEPVYQIVAL